MLCGVRDSDSQKVFASGSEKADGPFSCPGCKHELNLRKGKIKVHHFAHKPPYYCKRGEGESEAHRKCKETIYNCLTAINHVTDLDVEKDFGEVISDIFFKVNGVAIAIEIQRSNLSVNEITQRTIAYHNLGISVLWLGFFNDKLGENKYSPKAWEKWCHAVYFGKVYYWLADLTIIPVHFSEHRLYVEESSWYDSSGQEQYAGGYHRSSKRYRTPSSGKPINLVKDFKPTYKKAWSGGTVDVPNCRIYCDKNGSWWK